MSQGWGVFLNPPEVIPEGDLMTHPRGLACPCRPFLDGDVIVHNSFDMREDDEHASDPPPLGQGQAQAAQARPLCDEDAQMGQKAQAGIALGVKMGQGCRMLKVLCGIVIGVGASAALADPAQVIDTAKTYLLSGARTPDGTSLPLKMDWEGYVLAHCVR
jgi:hypothetical protein